MAPARSSVVYLLVGLPYDHKVWQDGWPRVMGNTIEACKRAAARLIFFDNVHMYGKVSGAMTEETPFKEFGFAGTPYADGIRAAATSFKRDSNADQSGHEKL